MKLLLIINIILLTGCSSSLMVFNEDKKLIKGIPVHSPIVLKETSVKSYKVLPGKDHEDFKDLCSPETTVSLKTYPLGEKYYVNFYPSQFSDAEFDMKVREKGTIEQITLNSKASQGLTNIKDLLGTVLPFYKAKKKSPDGSATEVKTSSTEATALRDMHCLLVSNKVISTSRVKIEE